MSRRRPRKTEHRAEDRQETGFDDLVVIRESAAYDRLLMEGMIHTTLAGVGDLPGATELAEVGVKIFDDPKRYGAVLWRSGQSRILQTEREGVLYLYIMGSAAKNDIGDDNAAVAEITSAIKRYQPTRVWTTAFARLLRAAKHLGGLLDALSNHVEALHCETVIKPGTPEGGMVIQVLGMISSMERDYIVRRHTAGRVAQWRRGEWIPQSHPPGYKVVDRRIRLDPDQVEPGRAMLRVLADHGLTTQQRIERLAQLGITTPKILKAHGPDATLADARNPTEALRTLHGWVDVLRTGEYLLRWSNPLPGVDRVAECQVHEVEPDDPDLDPAEHPHGVLHMPYRLELPDGGWADESVFEAIASRIEKTPRRGGGAHRLAPPLAGLFRYTDGDLEYALMAGQPTTYQLWRRTHDEARKHTGWNAENHGDSDQTCIAILDRDELQRSISNGVIDAVRSGVPGELDTIRFTTGTVPQPNSTAARLRKLRTEHQDEKQRLDRARRNARLAGEDAAAEVFVNEVKVHYANVEKLAAAIAHAEQAAEDCQPVLEKSFTSNVELASYGLGTLREVGPRGPGELPSVLAQVFTDTRLDLSGDDPNTMNWSLRVQLPHPDGTVLLGPVQGTVSCEPPPRPRPETNKALHHREAVEQALDELGLVPRAAAAAARCPHPDLSSALVLPDDLLDDTDPQRIDPRWVDHVRAVYFDPAFRWPQNHWRLSDSERVEVLAALHAAGGSLTVDAAIARGFKAERLRYLSRTNDTPTGDPILAAGGPRGERTYSLLECPHCGGVATASCVTPETRPGVLCPSCMRTPREDSPRYPDWYLNIDRVSRLQVEPWATEPPNSSP